MTLEMKNRMINDIEAFKVMGQKFLNKEINLKEFKGFSGGFGSYAERGGESFMLRLRMNQGIVTKNKLDFVAETIKKYGLEHIHFTTCQTIQLHHLTLDQVVDTMRLALDHDIICRGGGGDYPRNVMTTPLTGLSTDETFDVLPYAKAASEYLISVMFDFKLPRKLKVVFSNDSADEVHARFRDLGFIAKDNGKFDVYCAGGLGMNPKMGVKVLEDLEPNRVLYAIKAMIDTFLENGNYENRAKARTRYMQDTLGVDGLVKVYNEKFNNIADNLDLDLDAPSINNKVENKTNSWRAILQSNGSYTVKCHPIVGDIPAHDFLVLTEVVDSNLASELRIGPEQTIYLTNVKPENLDSVLDKTSFGASTIFETSVSCVGATICQVGLRDSKNTLKNAIDTLRNKNYSFNTLPRIHISGCPSSCGTHQIGRIGFQGASKLIDKKPYAAFQMTFDGKDGLDSPRFGEALGTILADDIAHFLEELGDLVEKTSLGFDAWYDANKNQFMELVKKYTA